MLRVFLGGPITHLLGKSGFDAGGEKIFRQAANLLNNHGFEVFSAHLLEDFGRIAKENDDIIVQRDLAWIDASNLCIFIFPIGADGKPVRTDGSYIELGYALALKKRIFIFWEEDVFVHYSPMLRGLSKADAVLWPLAEMQEVLTNFEKCAD